VARAAVAAGPTGLQEAAAAAEEAEKAWLSAVGKTDESERTVSEVGRTGQHHYDGRATIRVWGPTAERGRGVARSDRACNVCWRHGGAHRQ